FDGSVTLATALTAVDDGANPLLGDVLNLGGQFRRWTGSSLYFRLGLTVLPNELVLKLDQLDVIFLPDAQRLEHDFLWDASSAGLNHDDRVPASSDGQVEVALVQLLIGGVNNVFAVNVTH